MLGAALVHFPGELNEAGNRGRGEREGFDWCLVLKLVSGHRQRSHCQEIVAAISQNF